ncbi:MAG: hypothetical protein ABW208_08780, partial [Pyrinomonadaceae bacterium]
MADATRRRSAQLDPALQGRAKFMRRSAAECCAAFSSTLFQLHLHAVLGTQRDGGQEFDGLV